MRKYKIFIKSLGNISKKIKKVNCLCYNLWAKKYQVPLGNTATPRAVAFPLKLQNISTLRKYTTSNSPVFPNFRRGSYPAQFLNQLVPKKLLSLAKTEITTKSINICSNKFLDLKRSTFRSINVKSIEHLSPKQLYTASILNMKNLCHFHVFLLATAKISF